MSAKHVRRTTPRAALPKAPTRAQTDLPAESELAEFRESLLARLLEQTRNPLLRTALRRAALEAESLAWLTPIPMLVLPALLEEKAREARLYASRQAELRENSRDWVSFAE
jgi:hypothetical protein